MKPLIHLRLTPLAAEDPFIAEGKGCTILSALADMEAKARTGYGEHIDFSESWDIPDLIATLADPGTEWKHFDMSAPDDNCKVERLADVHRREPERSGPAGMDQSTFAFLSHLAAQQTYGDGPDELPEDNDCLVPTVNWAITRAQEIIALAVPHTKAPDVEALLPEGWEGPLERDADSFAVMDVPSSLIAHMRTFLGTTCSRVIGQLYGGEDLLIHLEEIRDDRDQLIADGWPPRFLERLEDLARADFAYLRIT